jgi:hypothetical protein
MCIKDELIPVGVGSLVGDRSGFNFIDDGTGLDNCDELLYVLVR